MQTMHIQVGSFVRNAGLVSVVLRVDDAGALLRVAPWPIKGELQRDCGKTYTANRAECVEVLPAPAVRCTCAVCAVCVS